MMNKIKLTSIIFVIVFSFNSIKSYGQSKKPNVIVFLADDFGYGSTNVYGASESLIKTPNINKLADEGVKFTNAYSTGSVCTPTRYALLTGQYSWRSRLKKGVLNSSDRSLIDLNIKTLPKYMQSLGYETAAIGKWHLGYKSEDFKDLLGSVSPGPNDHGFNFNFTVPNNLDGAHKIYIENDGIYGLRSDKICPYGRSFYGKPYRGYDAPQRVAENVMDDLTTKSIEWMDKVKDDKPFFLYFASVAVHHPIMPSPVMRGKSNAGAYGDFIQDIDRSLGILLNYLEEKGIRDNTIIIFASDNGGDIPNKKPMRPEDFAINKGLKINGDLRGDKHTIWEGGFKIPFIVNYPEKIKNHKTSDAIVSTVDIYAFLADYLDNNKGLESTDAPDSFSFADIINNSKSNYTRPPLVLRDAKGRKAVRYDSMKYIEAKDQNSKNKDDFEQLFNLSNDYAETNNLLSTDEMETNIGREYLSKVLVKPSKSIWRQ